MQSSIKLKHLIIQTSQHTVIFQQKHENRIIKNEQTMFHWV